MDGGGKKKKNRVDFCLEFPVCRFLAIHFPKTTSALLLIYKQIKKKSVRVDSCNLFFFFFVTGFYFVK